MVSMQEGWDLVFSVERNHTRSMWEEMWSIVLEQRKWNHLLSMQERVETNFPGIEDVGTMCCLCENG